MTSGLAVVGHEDLPNYHSLSNYFSHERDSE